jgi:Cu+-exporting ATPase
MTVDRHATSHRSVHDGVTYYFCSGHCKKRFDADPEQYVAAGETQPQAPVPEHAHHH